MDNSLTMCIYCGKTWETGTWDEITKHVCAKQNVTAVVNTSKTDHYNGTACLDAIKIATENLDGYEGFCTGNVIKYMWRWKKKNKLEDLSKAMNYIKFLIEYEENKQ